jgi:dTDP-4-dehydrorhamnose 3,5-epimerase
MPLKFTPTPLEGVILVESQIFEDQRGLFQEIFREDSFREAGIDVPLVQANRSFSVAGVLRGLHFQTPDPQAKLVSVSRGSIFDVAVDVREGSPNFGHWFGETLTDRNGLQLWIPAGFAHGFLALEDSVVAYQVSSFYGPKGEQSLLWNDPDLGIDWPIRDPLLSEKDRKAPRLREIDPAKLQA